MTTISKPLHRSVGASSLLLAKVLAYEIDDPNSEMKFSDRLAKQMLWGTIYTKRAIEEYKKFMFLAAVSREPVTPSLEVDEVWHLHMLYTYEYQEFCNILGKFIHHGPTRGGKQEDAKFIDWYKKTKDKYYMWFSQVPPEDIWPSSEVRFRPVHFVQVDLLTHWIVPAGDWKACLKCIWKFIKWKIKNLW